MKSGSFLLVLSVFLLFPDPCASMQQPREISPVRFSQEKRGESEVFILSNDIVNCLVSVESGKLTGDKLELLAPRRPGVNKPLLHFETDADFGLDIMWTDWQAPGRVNNAENLVILTKERFRFKNVRVNDLPQGTKQAELEFSGQGTPFEVRLVYELEPGAFYARRKLGLRLGPGKNPNGSIAPGTHFLRWIWPRRGALPLSLPLAPFKSGGFGQPVALLLDAGGVFCGLEYPTSENSLSRRLDGIPELACGQEIGERIAESWLESEWVVVALTPDPFIKQWFWKYLDRLRAAPLKPYILYNSWYDLRNPDYKKGPDRILDEKNLLNAARLLQQKLVDARGVRLDGFVLDDGWDTYAGDWVLSPQQFPRGLAPVSAALRPMDTRLGLWIGPIGGYFNRDGRVNWMKAHGYETVDGEMCVAGEHYKALLKKRIVDFIRNDGTGYFKWDGLQFSCSEPGHGHLPDIYSRRAVMETVADLCRTARAEGRDMFLNITSGTWLSPWWVKYADTIWMQGQDYGFADVPSISRRDQSTTYRDSVLFDDLRKYDFWFPVSSLMTHGVIKARVSPFTDPKEPQDKFVDEVVLYAARGIAMWELYISPDLLSDAEWDAEAAAIHWLKDNFETLKTVEMIGGDPRKHEPYGYVHFRGPRGIVALRNPVIEPQTLKLEFAPAAGLEPGAADLVLEKIYPSGWIAPRLFKAGEYTDLSLQGFETAVYEVYPLREAKQPLVAGARFDSRLDEKGRFVLNIYDVEENAGLLNPDQVREAMVDGKARDLRRLEIRPVSRPTPVTGIVLSHNAKTPGQIDLKFRVQDPAREAMLAILVTSEGEFRGKSLARVKVIRNGQPVEALLEQEKGSWAWHKAPAGPGDQDVQIQLSLDPSESSWRGHVSAWLIAQEKGVSKTVTFTMKDMIPGRNARLPQPYPNGIFPRSYHLGKAAVQLER
jgi:hypothetical protein